MAFGVKARTLGPFFRDNSAAQGSGTGHGPTSKVYFCNNFCNNFSNKPLNVRLLDFPKFAGQLI